MKRKTILINGVDFHIYPRKDAKRINMKARIPDGSIRLICPSYMREKDLVKLIEENFQLIEEVRENFFKVYGPFQKKYVEGETFPLWGKSYPLKIIKTEGRENLKFSKDSFILEIKEDGPSDKKEKFFTEFYRAQMKEKLPDLIKRNEDILGFGADDYRVRKMKTLWGSCNMRDRRIILNISLAKLPIECLNSVLIHELVHFLERDHNDRFYELVKIYDENYYESLEILNSTFPV